MNSESSHNDEKLKQSPEGGPSTELKRIDGHYIMHEIEHVLHFERGILYTIKALILNPGESVKNFLTKDRSRLVKPVIFVIITSLVYTIVVNLFHIEDGYIDYDSQDMSVRTPVTTACLKWVQTHYGYANIGLGVFIAFWAGIFFKKYKYNFFEILIMLCFVMGMGMLIYAVFAMVEGLTHIKVMQTGAFIGVVYSAWAIGHFFDKTKIINYIKAVAVYLLGMITAILLLTVTTVMIDILLNKF